MNAVLVKYNPNDRIVSGLLSVLANMNDVEIEDDVWLTDEEIKRVEKSKASGICTTDISELQKFLCS
jgi:hypothetical protein